MEDYNDNDGIELSEILAVAKYRSLGICKALGIERERFRDWVKSKPGFIKPTLPAMGQGTKAGFTLGDVYAIALFKKMTETGFKRELSANIVSKFMGISFNNPIEFSQYLICIVKTNPENGAQDTKVVLSMRGDGKDTLDININSNAITVEVFENTNVFGWDSVFIFNLMQLRQSVDLSLENAGL